ncbi:MULTISPECIES: BglG family transcription antiterminator LicT [Enterococcus]|uniref:PRD domain-containing protein n=1 Tax=Enterococcus raffinosus TaxID=71452 RepID=A0AAP5NEE6_9ENTE|nr:MULTISPECIES: PRD domain-containing protein [Enterococcus]SBA97548.1 BglG family transcriptional antiterminator [Enterococcus faecium]MBS6429809.1 PRD domain-containing protein [Enterococcus raffinosus]MDK7991200.1 PRD domain-containing protein [Enterococcus raffinosus]MDT2524433.1 PRD domain-containing protein [Enterococcus raffinosus]MDT2535163.1 PRD domain-containing protein [Enterococcus raffinosus]
MIIKRVLNNNTIISSNSKGVDVLLMGKGIAFGKKKGQVVDMEQIEKTFLLKDKETQSKFTELLLNVPMEHILVSEKIINFGKIKLGKNLNEIIYVNLTDHIHSAIDRYREGLILKNPLRWDIARFYPDEYAVGEKAIEVVRNDLGVSFEIDEAAFIAIHFVNAEMDKTWEFAYEIAEITKKIETIIKEHYRTEFDENSLDYYRFITHVKFFAQRLLAGDHYDDEDEELLNTLKHKYEGEYASALEIKEYVQKDFEYELSSTELLYLTAHIRRITKNL